MARLIKSLSSTSRPVASAAWHREKKCNSSLPIVLMMHLLRLSSKCCELWLLGLVVVTRRSAATFHKATTVLRG